MTAEPRAPGARHRLLAKAALLPILLAALPPAGPVHPVAAAAPVAGHIPAWGANAYGQVGDGTSTDRSTPTALALPPGTSVTAVAGGGLHSLAVTASGQVLAWGNDDLCQVGTAPCGGTVATPQQVALPAGTKVSSVAAGDNHSLALTSDGRVLAWGLNDYGQLGGGTTGGTFSSAALVCAPGTSGPCPAGPFLTGVTAIAAGGLHSLAVTGDGRAFAWGSNISGELGAASLADRSSTPLAVAVPPGTLVSGVAAGHGHSLALTSDGRVLAWGSNSNGQLGIGAASSLPGTDLSLTVLPMPVPLPSGAVAAQVSAGAAGSMALTTTGKVLAWGANGNGQVGDSTTTDRASPTLSGTGQAVVTALAAGKSHVLAITSSGSLLSWGGNASGQLGQGTPGSDGLTPAPVGLPAGLQVVTAAGGGDHSLLVTPDDVLTVTPAGSGAGSVTSAPAGIDCGASCVHAFAAGTAVTLTAAPARGSTFGGWSGSGCSGSGTCTVTLGGDAGVTATFVLVAPPTYTLAVTRSGSGSGTITSTPAGIACGSVCSAGFSSGTSVTLTAAAGAESLFSGWSGAGCSGTGTCTVVVRGPTSVTANFDPGRTLSVTRTGNGSGSVTSNPAGIDCGSTCSAAFPPGTAVSLSETPGDPNSTFAGWGGACSGSLTNCTVNLGSDQFVTASFALVTHTLSVVTTPAGAGGVTSAPAGISCGTVCSFAYPHGTSVTLTATAGPDPDSAFAGWSGACAGTGSCTVAMTGDLGVTATFQARAARVMGWGADDHGQVGDGAIAAEVVPPRPARLPPGTVITAVAAGALHSLAVTSDGQVLAWGQSAFCQLGTGPSPRSNCSSTDVASAIPVALPPGVTVTEVAAGALHSLALTSDGRVLAWGFNDRGQLGDGTLTRSAAPEQIPLPAGTVVTAIAAGANHSLALTSDGRVLAWGDNSSGQAGIPGVPLVPQPTPVTLPSGERATAISGGPEHTLAATAAGHVLAWGANDHGQLGIGTATPAAVAVPSSATLPAGSRVVTVSAGAAVSTAVTTAGQVLTWGLNASGQLGNGTTADSATPAAIALPLPAGATITAVATGASHCLALTSTGTVLAWGGNRSGELGGSSTAAFSAVPVLEGGLGWVSTIAAGGFHSMAIQLPVEAVLPAMSNGAYGGYVTAATIHNIGSQPAAVRITYFNQSGAPVGAGDSITTLAPGAGWTVRQDNGNGLPAGGGDSAQAGSAIVYSNQPIASFVNEFPPGGTGDATSYTGVQVPAGVGPTLYAPTIVNGAYGGYTTGIGLLNEGRAATDVTITYRDGGGAVIKTQTVTGLAANAYQPLYSGDGALGLPANFAGTATITSSAGQPLGAVVNETGPGGQLSSYDAVPSGSTGLNAPVALNNAYGGYFTGMGIQNTSAGAGTVTVTYYDTSGTATAKSFPIGGNGYLGVYQGSGTDGPAPGAYTAVIQGTVPVAAIVNEVAPSSGSAQQSTSYNTFGAGSPTLHLALVENAGSDGWSTGEGIMNTGAATTTVTVSYSDAATGASIGTPQTQTLAPHAFWGLYQGPPGGGGLPAGARATAAVTTSGGQVAVICNEAGPTSFMSYDGQ